MRRQFDDALLLGQIGENAVASMLSQRGFNMQRNCDGAVTPGHGPSLKTPAGDIPLPDFTISARGVSIASEIKTKTDRTVGVITGETETGIDYQKWLDYKDYKRATGAAVFLFFVEYNKALITRLLQTPAIRSHFETTGKTTHLEIPDAVYGQWQDRLKPSLNTPTECYGKQMIYFALRQFKGFPGCIDLLNSYIDSNAKSLV